MTVQTCVIRSVRGNDEFIPVEDAVIQHGETVHIGYFERSTVKDGPSGSHERTICTPKQKPRTLSLTCCHIGMVAPSRDWRAISNPIRYSNNERIFINTRQAADLAS